MVCVVHPFSMLFLIFLQAAGDATKHEPPNGNAFDGARDGCIVAIKPRGRVGPFPQTTADAPVFPNFTQQTLALLMSSLTAIVGGLGPCKRGRSESQSPTRPLPGPSTPKRKKAVTTDSPLPEKGLELRACLRDFAKLEGIDFTSYEIPLRMEDYSPDIIPFVEDTEIRRLLDTTSGIAIKLKIFCKNWYNRHQQKLHNQI